MTARSDIARGRLDSHALASNFSDLHPAFGRNEARVAAERCLFCYDAPCVKACPTSIDIPMFIREIMTGNTVGAARTILESNIMGGMCARVCPTETLCEEACVKEASEGRAVEIGNLQRYATDDLFAKGRQLFKRGAPTGKRVAVVGAGPAGLSCAHKLATLGHEVTVFEAREKAGGLNEYGIAAYKSTGGFAQAEVDYITAIGGITIDYGKRLGRDVELTDLAKHYDAVFLGMGLGDTNDLGLEDGIEGVIDAVDYIADLRQAEDLASLPVGRRIVVIGGGMTAIDIASQTKRLGAESVTIAYRRGQPQMNASGYEQEVAQTDGVLIRHWLKPSRLHAEGGKLVAVELEYTVEENGRLAGTGEKLVLDCDQLFTAIGQSFLPQEINGVLLTLEKGRIVVDDERRSSVPGVWAGGDCVAGGKDLTVAAVEDGKQAALSIDRALKSQVKAA
ncbi:NAD(P)-dependent oxidoreductase [Labrys neptuniae]